MNVFVIHSGSDREKVDSLVSELKKQAFSLNALVLKNGNAFWKLNASSKIKKSQMVIVVVGEKSHQSPYIGWEIETAIKHKKPIYILKLHKDFNLHKSLFIKDKFTDNKACYGSEKTVAELAEIIKNHDSGNYNLFNYEPDETNKSVLLEQYKLFLQTSEDLVKRRQTVNSFYISINSAMVAALGAMFALDFNAHTKMLIGILFSLIGIFLSLSWSKTLISYGNLNSSKMKIISCIEKQLPLSLYDAEWAALSDKLNKKKYISFTNSEKKIPLLFLCVYIVIVIVLTFSIIF